MFLFLVKHLDRFETYMTASEFDAVTFGVNDENKLY